MSKIKVSTSSEPLATEGRPSVKARTRTRTRNNMKKQFILGVALFPNWFSSHLGLFPESAFVLPLLPLLPCLLFLPYSLFPVLLRDQINSEIDRTTTEGGERARGPG